MHRFSNATESNRLQKKSLFRQSCQALSLAGAVFLSFSPVADVSSDTGAGAPSDDPLSRVSLCDWQRDYRFFSRTPKTEKVDTLPCEEAFLKTAKLALKEEPQPVASSASSEKQGFEQELRDIVSGYPIEAMVPAIAEYDRDIAGLIVGIAKKESNWGKRVPRTDTGDDCFNYWGYKGAGARGIAMGHGCFGEPAEAVHTIGHRLQELVAKRNTSEPASLIIWKCGSSCAGHSPESVRKWISDVDMYYREIANR
ncbi:MAG: hypothetical protein WAT81_00080 [Candidatus Moraniibacteriota bacterium]